jgi:hypothetical protein
VKELTVTLDDALYVELEAAATAAGHTPEEWLRRYAAGKLASRRQLLTGGNEKQSHGKMITVRASADLEHRLRENGVSSRTALLGYLRP